MRASTERPWRTTLLAAAIPVAVLGITFLVFAPAIRNGFVSWDDDRNFLTNFHYRGLGLTQLRWMWSTFHLGHYVPLSWMSLGGDYLLWGMNPAGYHLTNVVLHSINALLVYCLAERLLGLVFPERRASGGATVPLAAAFAALIFSLHPLRVESVAWITERRDVLSFAFYVGSALLYLRSLERTERQAAWYWLSVATFACALLSKATAVTLPAILLILNVFPLRRIVVTGSGLRSDGAQRVYREMIPFVTLSVATIAMTFVALQHLTQLSIGGKIAVSAYSVAFYLLKTTLPLDLAPLYAMPQAVDALAARYVVSYLVILAASVGAWMVRRDWPAVTAAWVAFAVTVFPMLGLVQNGPQLAADRYTYFPAPFLGVLGGIAFVLLLARSARIASALAVVVLVVLAAGTQRQLAVWHDSNALWRRVLSVEPSSPVALNNMGNLFSRRGQLDSATHYYRAAATVMPGYPEAHNNLGVVLAKQGSLQQAIVEYQAAITAFPGYDEAYDNWGVALAAQGRLSEAATQYERAIALNPENSDAHVNLGNAWLRLGDVAGAMGQYAIALRVRPDNADAYLNWGVALARRGELEAAIEKFRSALAIRADHPEANEYLQRSVALMQARQHAPPH